ncbi:hypothetical protein [Acholeplasma hippikon]|uniref:Uncharacterized protein n=1 Tax=Acholeplasma hippikon TaxID=264636 RepID=A0A449BJG6_9MOLU|nr:hypothetical protein [Acholeplasma hippikon]VEU82606.1 Uncharacterised protein [Acholeplasma hippikon]
MDFIIEHALDILLELVIVAIVHFVWSKKQNRLKFDFVTVLCFLLLIIFGIIMPIHSAEKYGHEYTTPWLLIIYITLALCVGLSTFIKFKFLHHEHECMEVEMTECIIKNKRANLIFGKGLHSLILFCKSLTVFVLIGNLINVLIQK